MFGENIGRSLNESLPHKRKRPGVYPRPRKASVRLNESLPHKRKRRDVRSVALDGEAGLNESLPHKRKRRPPNFSSFELLKLRASRA